MRIFGDGGRRGPRLAPELDDTALGRVCRPLNSLSMAGLRNPSVHINSVEAILREVGDDWDRRMHRLTVLCGSAASAPLARSWISRHPQNADASVFHVWAGLDKICKSRNMADAHTLIDDCYRAAQLRPDDPAPWVALLGLFRLLRRPQSDLYAIWREVTGRDRRNREAYLQMLGYLSPQECGSFAQVRNFIEDQHARVTVGSPVAGMEIIAMINRHHQNTENGGLDALLSRHWWEQPPAATAVDRAFSCWTKPGFLRHAAALADLNALAFALIQSNRMADAAVVFQMIGGTVSPWPWSLIGDPLEQYSHWSARATRWRYSPR